MPPIIDMLSLALIKHFFVLFAAAMWWSLERQICVVRNSDDLKGGETTGCTGTWGGRYNDVV